MIHNNCFWKAFQTHFDKQINKQTHTSWRSSKTEFSYYEEHFRFAAIVSRKIKPKILDELLVATYIYCKNVPQDAFNS